jgi:hypothetical protein
MQGEIYVGDMETPQPFVPGVMALVPARTPHRIVNLSTDEQLQLVFTLSPPQSVAQFVADKNRA